MIEEKKREGGSFKLFTIAIRHFYTAVAYYSPTTSLFSPVATATTSSSLWAPTRLSPGRISSVTLKTTSDCCEAVCKCVAVVCKRSAEYEFETRHVWGLAILWADMSWFLWLRGDKRLRVPNIQYVKAAHFHLLITCNTVCIVHRTVNVKRLVPP